MRDCEKQDISPRAVRVGANESCDGALVFSRKRWKLSNVDAEGADVEILQSHDWNSNSPACVVVERLHGNLSGRINALGLLLRQGYVQIAQTPFSAIFRHQPKKKQGVLRARR